MTTTRQDERIDARLSRENKALLKRAADLSGQAVSQFLVASALERARVVIDEHSQTKLSAEAGRRFISLIENDEPTAALRSAAKRYRGRHERG